MRRADVEAQLVEIGVALSGQADKLGRAVAAAIRAEIDFYRNTTVIGDDELIENCTSNLRSVFRGLQGIQTFDTTPAESTGITRADAGVPLPALMGAYRVGFRISWQAVMQLADANPGFGRTTLLIAAQRMWEAHDVYVDAMSTAFRERQVQQVLEDEAERAALTEHLLEGRITDNQTLWEVAQLLGLPSNGPYVVVAAICSSDRQARVAWDHRPIARSGYLLGVAAVARPADRHSASRTGRRACIDGRSGASIVARPRRYQRSISRSRRHDEGPAICAYCVERQR